MENDGKCFFHCLGKKTCIRLPRRRKLQHNHLARIKNCFRKTNLEKIRTVSANRSNTATQCLQPLLLHPSRLHGISALYKVCAHLSCLPKEHGMGCSPTPGIEQKKLAFLQRCSMLVQLTKMPFVKSTAASRHKSGRQQSSLLERILT